MIYQFKSGFARKLGYIAAVALVAAASALFSGKAQAHVTACPLGGSGKCDEGTAKEAAQNPANAMAHCIAVSGTNATRGGWLAQAVNVQKQYGGGGNGWYWSATIQCRSADLSGNFFNNGGDQYYFGKSCLDRNAELGETAGAGKWGRATDAGEKCVAGCRFVRGATSETQAMTVSAAGQTAQSAGSLIRAPWEYTGETCSATPMPTREEEKPKTECSPLVNGVKVCKSKESNNCITSGAGRFLCWAPNENGSKTDGTVTQTKTPGTQPPGSLEGSTNTNTTNITNNTTNSTTSTTINNYTTNNGSPAGPTNSGTGSNASGEPASTSPSGSGTGGTDEDGNDNTSAGGGTCDQAPVSSGDQILGNILIQTWHTRCNAKKGELAGNGTCSEQGTVVGFACSGDQIACATALRTRELACKAELNRQEWTGDDDTGDNPDDLDTVFGDGDDAPPLDAGGFGWGRACPELPQVYGRSIQVPFLCDSLQLIGALVLLLAYFHAGRIVAR